MKSFTFIDLFAGIGGFHIAMQSLGGTCVFASEIDKFARKTYEHNFYNHNPELFIQNCFNDDIRELSSSDLPDFDILCAGFPCQPFSQAGYKRGFKDVHNSERGNLFYYIVEILEAKKPKAFFLENVRGILNHNNGKTFAEIRNVLEKELGYSFYYKVLKASEYGLPQLRPRVYIIGFKDDWKTFNTFEFPEPTPLEFTMSDVWNGNCDRDIGFTLRVGGRGSDINDRRNWDHYLVDGEVRKLMPEQAKKMQGFPEDFEFPVSSAQAMKQLGNSVAVNVIKACGKQIIKYLSILDKLKGENLMNNYSRNKGEWTEIYSFLKILHDKGLFLADEDLRAKSDFLHVSKVSTLNMSQECMILEDKTIKVVDKNTKQSRQLDLSNFLTDEILDKLVQLIKTSKGRSFRIKDFEIINDKLGFVLLKGGNSNQKSDIVLDFIHKNQKYCNSGLGIKSYLGSKPTLLNASSNTNFVFKVNNLSHDFLDQINDIETRTKIIDRINAIYRNNGYLEFYKVEKTTMAYNLDLVDGCMPNLIALMLLEFYKNRKNDIENNLKAVFERHNNIFSTDLDGLRVKIKRLLVSILLGFFAGTKWDGKYISNGTIVVKSQGEQVAYHIIDLESLENYLYNNVRFDSPSTSRHNYGSLFLEKNKLYFKLNLQLRF